MFNENIPKAENLEIVFEREIKKALSPVWAKSIQELLPGYLPNKQTGEYTRNDLDMYKKAFTIVGSMVKSGVAEAVFEETDNTSSNSNLEYEHITQQKFKLASHTGKKSLHEHFTFGGEMVLE